MANKSLLITDKINPLASVEAMHQQAEIVYLNPSEYFSGLSDLFTTRFGRPGNDLLCRAYNGETNDRESAEICRVYYDAFIAAAASNSLNKNEYSNGINMERLRVVILERGTFEDNFVFGNLLRDWLKESGVILREYGALRTNTA